MSFIVRILQAKKDESGEMPQCFTGIGPETLETLWGLSVPSLPYIILLGPLSPLTHSLSLSLSFSLHFASMIRLP